MLRRWTIVLLAAAGLTACSTPFHPPVIAYGGAPFNGIAGLVERNAGKQVDVLMVHGMCTHTRSDARKSIDTLVQAVDSSLLPDFISAERLSTDVDGIEVETRTVDFGKASVRFTALVWSPLTTPLKAQLAYDHTGTPTDCSMAGECRPQRATLNGQFKDKLLDDCLADVMIYQGESRKGIRQRMINAITHVVEDSESQARAKGLEPGPFALVAESLGSKISFDALDEMDKRPAPDKAKVAGDSAVDRLALIFMLANQLPMLSLAEQTIEPPNARPAALPEMAPFGAQDSLQQLLKRKGRSELNPIRGGSIRGEGAASMPLKLALVAFTDPNDLLSFRLLPSRYSVQGIDIADVLVSNDATYFGILELPTSAHTDYRKNMDVTRYIACGSVGSELCK